MRVAAHLRLRGGQGRGHHRGGPRRLVHGHRGRAGRRGGGGLLRDGLLLRYQRRRRRRHRQRRGRGRLAGDPCADGLRLERLTPNLSLPLPYGPRKPPPSGARLRAARILRPYCGPAERSSRVIERYPSLA